MNHYELVSHGIDQKIIDGKFYAKCAQTIFVRIWRVSGNFVEAAREVSGYNHTLSGFEDLGKQWKAELDKKKTSTVKSWPYTPLKNNKREGGR